MFAGSSDEQRAQRKAYDRAKNEGQRTWKLAGWKSLYPIAIEKRWFEVPGRTPYECVYYGDFEQLAYFMSLHNAVK